MNESHWSPFQWILWVAGVFIFQVGVIWLLGDRGLNALASQTFGTRIVLAPEMLRGRAAPELPDPASLALPNANGFSGDAWLKYTPPTHALAEWTEPPRWLALSNYVAMLPDAVSQLVAESRPAPLRIADEPLPWNSSADTLVARLPLPEYSRLEFEGDILLDIGVAAPELRSWQSNDPVDRSIVRVAFDKTGTPFSCVLVGKSGLDEADNYAIRVATSLRFRSPLGARPDGGFRFGKLVFHWHVVPTAATSRGVTSVHPTP